MKDTTTHPAIRMAKHQLEMLLELEIRRELQLCCLDLNEDPAVSDPKALIEGLATWFAEKLHQVTAEVEAQHCPEAQSSQRQAELLLF